MKASWIAVIALPCYLARWAGAADITIDGGRIFQTVDGFGVNANHRSWNNDELKPALDALIDQAGMTLFRVVYENSNWESTNDNNDSNSINWGYFSPIYTSPEFQKFWALMAYLNQKGITNGVMPNLQGFGPEWMGGASLDGGLEGEWAEMMTSLFVYGRYSNHVAFNLVAPHNEPDLAGSGIGISNAAQYIVTLKELAQRLDANGMGDVRFVGPDRIFDNTAWLTNILADPAVMARMGHFGAHSYSGFGGGTDGIDDLIKSSNYPDRNYWVTEFGVWCDVCQSSWQGTNTWEYARATAEYILYYLGNNASAVLAWDGYDGIYLNDYDDNPHPSSWGLLALDDPTAALKTYTPRKAFYTVSQISKFVRPGARRVNVDSDDPILLLGFYHPTSGQLTLAGVNPDGISRMISGTLTNLPPLSTLESYYTDATHNLTRTNPVAVVNGIFTATVPANSVFTLNSPLLPDSVISNPRLTNQEFSFTLSGTPGFNYLVESSTNLRDWVASGTISNSSGQVTCRATNSPPELLKFYRARRLP